MLNSVSGNVQNDVAVQKNKIQKSNIAYRGKATNALEVTPEKDEFKKQGLGKGSKILLGTLGLAGIAVAVDRLFLKGKYTDDILKWLKNNGDDVTKGANEGTDDFGRIVDDEIDLTGISAEDLKSLDDMDFEKLVDDVDLEKLADEAERVLADPSAIKKADIISDGVSKPIEKTVKETAEEVQVITPNKNEIVENIEDEVARTKKLIEDTSSQAPEFKVVDDAENAFKKTIKELDDEAEKVAKKQQEEARRIEQENMDMAVMALLADDALRQGKNKVDDVAKSLENKIDDVIEKIEDNVAEDLVTNARKNSDNVLGDIVDSPFNNKVDTPFSDKVDDVVDDFATSRNNYSHDNFGAESVIDDVADDITTSKNNYSYDNFGSESVMDDVVDDFANHTIPDAPSLYEAEVANMSPYSSSFGIDDFNNPTINPMSGIDDMYSPSFDLGDYDVGGNFLDNLSDML